MSKETGSNSQRITIQYFDGVNGQVQQAISLKTELLHSENARSPIIGVLEKREGQTVVGTDIGGDTFLSEGNYGLTYFDDGGTLSSGPIRVSSKNGVSADMYYLNTDDEWVPVNNGYAGDLSLVNHKFVNIDNNLLIVNGTDSNRMIVGEIGTTTEMITADTEGSLFNSPRANIAAFYKSRIYLADYFNDSGVELKTTILRSSYPMGIVSLLNGDVSSGDNETDEWTLPMTDIKYLYSDDNMDEYDIYRGNTKIATIIINSVTETGVTARDEYVTFEAGYTSFLSADEVWVAGTFTGEKQYRWVSNATTTGLDVKQYDSFKLSGGDEDAVTMMEPIGNILMIANKNALMTWNDYSLENFDMGIGCCSKNGYVKNGELYFIHYSGIYSTGGGIPKLLSRKVERYINGATKTGLEASAIGTKGLSIFCTIGDVTLYNNDGSTWKVLPNVCLEYATADQNWYVHTNVTSTIFETYMATSGAEKLVMASVTAATNDSLGSELIENGGFTDVETPWESSGNWISTGSNMQITNV